MAFIKSSLVLAVVAAVGRCEPGVLPAVAPSPYAYPGLSPYSAVPAAYPYATYPFRAPLLPAASRAVAAPLQAFPAPAARFAASPFPAAAVAPFPPLQPLPSSTSQTPTLNTNSRTRSATR
ncbi:unnamed protein product [Aphis gossypii]|uniref:Uncharacterized protein n=1 Tax=Aphis gossypii TaxID=80765 RepID=A0A9P0JIL9_APHGO|nr:unnamed protein product [Aphis gossypii]